MSQKKYETLDEYLDDLDGIKEKIAKETEGMNTAEVLAYFAKARSEAEKLLGKKLIVKRPRRKKRTASW